MKITENIELIDGTMANCYSVNLDGRQLLIDTGTRGSSKKIIDYYRKNNLKPEIVLITHYHPDHVGGLKSIRDEFGAKIYAPDAEIGVISGKERMTPAKSLASRLVSGFMKSEPVEGLSRSSELSLEGLEVVETPGHTPGSTSYFFSKDNVLFVGDAVVVSSGKLGLNKAFTLDMAKAEESRKKILEHPAQIILSGHGEVYSKSGNETSK